MRRFYIDEIDRSSGALTLTGPEARHITRVLRMDSGDRIVVMDRKGSRIQALITSVRRNEVQVLVERRLPPPPAPQVDIFLGQAILKSRAMDYVIQKTSELGVSALYPFSSARSVLRPDERQYAEKRRHWVEISRAATKQSDRVSPPEVGPRSSLEALLGQWRKRRALKIILWEGEEARDLKHLLRSSTPEKALVGLVGPEGGFTREEIGIASEAGFLSVSLGRRILRAETAAVTLVALVQYEWGDLSLGKDTSDADER
ncbi:MAG: 16S rRNA (uracil(1498)-N(3))-methyltransferase [Deltaproteobacteria bacterium]|nr:16S rRNA (uracil(1498)-N(3))-methyltransferase [Deltaproteobacteria bacterium]